MKVWLSLVLLAAFVSSCEASSVAVTTTIIPNALAKKSYLAVIKASGGCTPYKWAIASGMLPAGVTAKASTTTTSITLSGTPTTAATYSFTVKVTGCGGAISQKSYKIIVQAAAKHVVDLSWTPSSTSNVVGYNVYRGPDGSTWKKVNVSLIGSSLYSDSSVANSSTYFYAATAIDNLGHESKKTTSVKAVVPN